MKATVINASTYLAGYFSLSNSLLLNVEPSLTNEVLKQVVHLAGALLLTLFTNLLSRRLLKPQTTISVPPPATIEIKEAIVNDKTLKPNEGLNINQQIEATAPQGTEHI